jgi:acid phosphatase type 7
MQRYFTCRRIGASRIEMVVVFLLLVTLRHAYAQPPADGRPFFDPVGLYLTWRQDPTTTMTIDWHSTNNTREPVLDYRVAGSGTWMSASARSHAFPFSDRTIHRVELTGLDPATTYRFRFGHHSRIYSFRTMPVDASTPIRFAAGGDVRHDQVWMGEVNRQVLRYDPDFIIFGGDLAYADGREDRVDRWYEWFDAYKRTLVTEDGRVVPVVAAIGNHEVRGGYYHRDDHERRAELPPYAGDDVSRAAIAPYFYSLFAMPGQPGYNVLDFGDYMSIVLLDTDHSNPIDGEQARWLADTLEARRHVPHVFPLYHVPAFPSVRSYHGSVSARVREHWVPLFERSSVRVAFENHDHAYKRTHPIRDGRVSQDGIVYIGDGCWGVGEREIGRDQSDEEPWYIKRARSRRHFILTTIHGPHQHFLIVDRDGHIIDEYPETPRLDRTAPLHREDELRVGN